MSTKTSLRCAHTPQAALRRPRRPITSAATQWLCLVSCTAMSLSVARGAAVAAPVGRGRVDAPRTRRWWAPDPPETHTYVGASGMVSNPERGFRMELDTGCDRGGITAQQLAQMRQFNLTVAQTYCYLPADPTLAPDTLKAVANAFAALRTAGVKALFRFAYDRSEPGTEDYTAETVLGHVRQLAPIVQANADALYVLQAGFLGSWGEWHSSKNNLSENATVTSALVEGLLFTMLPPDRKINVRVPSYKLSGVLRRTAGANTDGPPPPNCSLGASAPTRVACPGAFGGITAAQCKALGCCFSNSTPGVAFCFVDAAQLLPRPVAAATSDANGGDRMGYGVLDAASSKLNTAVARVGFDNDGFMSTSNDGGTFGNQYTRPTWRSDPTAAKTAPYPDTIAPVNGSLSTPVYSTASRGPNDDPGYDYAQRESPWVPVDGEMFWKAGSMVYDKSWPQAVTAEQAAWRLRAMHYSTLSLVHGFNALDSGGVNETIDRWTRTPLDLVQVLRAGLPISPAYAVANHTGYEYVRDHLGYRIELRTATFPPVLRLSAGTGEGSAANDGTPEDDNGGDGVHHALAPPSPAPTFVLNATVVNWGFAAPVSPRPMLLVLLLADTTQVVWQSPTPMAVDVRDWQPYRPGDPTFTPIEHAFGGVVDGVDASTLPAQCREPEGCTLAIGLLLGDMRLGHLATSEATAEAYSLRFANDEASVPWAPVPAGKGGVNVLGTVKVYAG